jgi:hypothetical protein
MVFNDLIYLLDESLQKLQEIHEIEDRTGDAAAWSRTPEVRTCPLALCFVVLI